MFHDDDDDDDVSSSSWFALFGLKFGLGAQMRIVASSDADASIDGYTGFHDTQFTVRVWPVSRANGSSRFICHMYT